MDDKDVKPAFQSIRDTVKTVGLSEYCLRKMLKNEQLPHVMNGTKVMVDVPMLFKQLRRRT